MVRQLDPAERWFLKLYMAMLKRAQRVFVTTPRRTGTGPLVMVGAELPKE